MLVPPPFWKTSTAPATVTYVTTIDDASGATTYTFTAANIGIAAADRLVVVGVVWEAGGDIALSNGTIGGAAASLIVTGTARRAAGLMALRVTTGTTATIAITLSGAATRAAIGIWNVNGQSSDTPTDFGQDAATSPAVTSKQVDVDVASGGVAIAMLGLNSESSSVTWTGADERFDAAYATFARKSGADYSNAGADETPHSIIASFASADGGLAAASFR